MSDRDQPLERVRVFGDPVLREESREVTEFDDKLLRLVDRMFEAMERESGVGLAAPQIGVQRKVMVWEDPETEERYVLVNPRITQRSGETITETEGCLSLPGHPMEVTRSERVVVEGYNLAGEQVSFEAAGLLARIMQHEIDHLEGHLILDRTDEEERRRVLREIREQSLGS